MGDAHMTEPAVVDPEIVNCNPKRQSVAHAEVPKTNGVTPKSLDALMTLGCHESRIALGQLRLSRIVDTQERWKKRAKKLWEKDLPKEVKQKKIARCQRKGKNAIHNIAMLSAYPCVAKSVYSHTDRVCRQALDGVLHKAIVLAHGRRRKTISRSDIKYAGELMGMHVPSETDIEDRILSVNILKKRKRIPEEDAHETERE